jgi:hypothetical protein
MKEKQSVAAMGGAGGMKRPVFHVNELKKTGALSARALSAARTFW